MKNILLAAFGLILLFSCSSSVRKYDTAEQLLTKKIDSIYQFKKFNGFSVAIVNEEGAIYDQAFGFADASQQKKYTTETIQNIGSVSKTLIGIALLKAQELGKLKLDDPIENYLPFKVCNPNYPLSKITIRQLATHTSSIVDNDFYSAKNYYLKPNQDLQGLKLTFEDHQTFNSPDSILTLAAYLENVLSPKGSWNSDSFSENQPGTFYEYSNTATALAALVLENATGQPFDQFTKKYILAPLKMKSSGWKREAVQKSKYSRLYENPTTPFPYYELITYPDGGFITSSSDLGRYLSELIKGYNGRGTILSKASYREYFTPQLNDDNFKTRNTKNPYSESYNVGILIGFGPTGFVGHTGSDPGTMSMMFFDPKTKVGRLMILNTNISDPESKKSFIGIWNALGAYQKLSTNKK